MKKSHPNSGIGSDNWLYIATHALSLYVEEGGRLDIRPNESGIVIEFLGVQIEDSRVNSSLRELVYREEVSNEV